MTKPYPSEGDRIERACELVQDLMHTHEAERVAFNAWESGWDEGYYLGLRHALSIMAEVRGETKRD